ncbi:MAG: hypothetical protein HWE34_08795 [Methylocystaceae bacterium]|nr:hypothetical protein [Methylocystaceae bacterium]
MSIFDWQEAYVIDHAMIDEQHKKLLVIAEKLFNAVIAKEDTKIVETAFQDLLAYTQKHFKDEEDFFISAGAPQVDKHQTEHAILAQELVEVWQKESLGFEEEPGRTLLTWVEDRLLPHMMIDDQETYKSQMTA